MSPKDQEKTNETRTREVDAAGMDANLLELKANQHLGRGILFGAGAAIAGSIVWGLITGLTHHQLGVLAIGMGLLVGFAVRWGGKGVTLPFAIAGALLALFGAALGNILAAVVNHARATDLSVFFVLKFLNLEGAWNILKNTSQPMDALFYALAAFEGYRFSLKRPRRREISSSLNE